MAIVTLNAFTPDYIYWADFFTASANVTARTATAYNYTSVDGYRVSLAGGGFQYDAANPNAFVNGTIGNITVRNALNQVVFQITGLSADAVTYFYNVNGSPGFLDPNSFETINYLLLGNDTINGSNNGDDIGGGRMEGNDIINANGGDDFIKGSRGNDTIRGGDGFDTLSYQETFFADFGAFRGINLNATTGKVIDSWGNTDTISGIEDFRGSAFNDVIVGSAAPEEFFMGFRGRDIINGGAGYDLLLYTEDAFFGATHGIRVDMAAGQVVDSWGQIDTIAGIETVEGTKFADVFFGGAGNDEFVGHAGLDSFSGGAGVDRVKFNGADGDVTVNLNRATGQVINDGFGNTETFVSIEDVWGGPHNDRITGNSVGNSIRGRQGNDILNGGAGADVMSGDEGNDLVAGGAGADNFRFRTALGAVNQDRIVDFNPAEDTIQFERSIVAALPVGPLAAAAFKSGLNGAAADTSDRIIYNTTNGQVWYDSDGIGATAAQLVATLLTKPALTAADFVVI